MPDLEHHSGGGIRPLQRQVRYRDGVADETLTGNVSLTEKTANLLNVDPGGSARTITLPAEADSAGLWFCIYNAADADEDLTIQDDTPTTVVVLEQGESAVVACDGSSWKLYLHSQVDLSSIKVDTISESTSANGVAVDGLTIKDGGIDLPFAAGGAFNTETLAGAKTLVVTDAMFQRLDPDGAGRDVNLPAEASSDGKAFRILNLADAAEALTVKDDGAATIAALAQNEAAWFICDGTSWVHMGIETIALS